jgi:hypothetical protein
MENYTIVEGEKEEKFTIYIFSNTLDSEIIIQTSLKLYSTKRLMLYLIFLCIRCKTRWLFADKVELQFNVYVYRTCLDIKY